MSRRNFAGQQVNWLSVQEEVLHNGKLRWRCICRCGTESFVAHGTLCDGRPMSCGCYRYSIPNKRATRQGRSRTPEYVRWANMIRGAVGSGRHRAYDIDPRWVASFDAYLADVGYRPSPKHRLFRRDVSLGFFKENCEWRTF